MLLFNEHIIFNKSSELLEGIGLSKQETSFPFQLVERIEFELHPF